MQHILRSNKGCLSLKSSYSLTNPRNIRHPYSTLESISKKNWDFIVVGAGHNGLVTAAYLAKNMKDASVLVLEKRDVIGGAAVSEEIIPGFKFSRCSYLSGLFRQRIIDELNLKHHGLKFLPRNPSSFTPLLNAPPGKPKYLMLGADPEMNHKEISKFSKKDAERFPHYEATLERISRFFEQFLDEEPISLKGSSFTEKLRDIPKMVQAVQRTLQLGSDLPTFIELLTAPASKILRRWFESEPLISTLATDSIIGAMTSPGTPGSGYVLLHHVMGVTEGHRGIWSYVEGGMGGISKAIASSATTSGVTIQTGVPVRSFDIDDKGKATGVVLENGSTIKANKCVISNATPWVTFKQLCPSGSLPQEFESHISNFDFTSGVTKINLALSELPNFTACPNTAPNQPGPQHYGTIHLCDDLGEIETAFAEGLQGKPSTRPIIEMTIPTSLDKTLAPPGKHVATLFIQYTPTVLKNGRSWEDPKTKEEFANRVYDLIDKYAPGFKKSIIGADVLSPLDLEKIFGLTGGNIFHGAMGIDQLYFMRPAPGYANYRTPISGLYMCGSGTHPGGGVMGAAGRNAAMKILNDFAK